MQSEAELPITLPLETVLQTSLYEAAQTKAATIQIHHVFLAICRTNSDFNDYLQSYGCSYENFRDFLAAQNRLMDRTLPTNEDLEDKLRAAVSEAALMPAALRALQFARIICLPDNNIKSGGDAPAKLSVRIENNTLKYIHLPRPWATIKPWKKAPAFCL